MLKKIFKKKSIYQIKWKAKILKYSKILKNLEKRTYIGLDITKQKKILTFLTFLTFLFNALYFD